MEPGGLCECDKMVSLYWSIEVVGVCWSSTTTRQKGWSAPLATPIGHNI